MFAKLSNNVIWFIIEIVIKACFFTPSTYVKKNSLANCVLKNIISNY